MPTGDVLFCKVDWHSVRDHQRQKLQEEVGSYDGNRLLNTSVEDMCDYLERKYAITVPTLHTDAIVADQSEIKVDVSNDFCYGRRMDGRPNLVDGTSIEITVPFSGDAGVFSIRPTTYGMNPPRASVKSEALVLRFRGIDLSADRVRSEIDRSIESLQEYLNNLRRDADGLNSGLRALAKTAVEARRTKLLANQSLVSSLGFTVKERSDSPRTYVAPEVRRRVSITPPAASTARYQPEPCLSDGDYEHILGVIQNMAHVMERSPTAFVTMDEESLRTHFLVQLNGHYEGQATGETFNFQGKTDILIRVNGKNIFIAECKFWTGPKKLTETIDQLLGYSSWRDTKVAVLVFNRNKDFTRVLESIQTTMREHSNFKRVLERHSETSFRYIFSHRDDPNREMILTVLAFEIPTIERV